MSHGLGNVITIADVQYYTIVSVKEIASVAGSDPDSMGSQDPDPGRQKLPTKMKKVDSFHFLTCLMFSFEG